MTPECTGMNWNGTKMNGNDIRMIHSVPYHSILLHFIPMSCRYILGHSDSLWYHPSSFWFISVYSVPGIDWFGLVIS